MRARTWCDVHADYADACGCDSTLSPSDSTHSTLSTPSDASGSGRLLAGLRTGAWLEGQTFPPIAYAVPGIIPEGMTLLVGPPKVGKSWLTFALALAVASGGVALGGIALHTPRPVLLLALEDSDRRLQSRARLLLAPGSAIPPRLHYLTRLVPGTVVATVSAWADEYADDGGLVIIDTLGKVLPPAMPGESAYARDYRVAGGIKRVADDRPGLAVVVVHHDRKAGSEDFVDAVSGTHGLAGAADTITVLGRPRVSGEGLLRVTGRDVVERDYAVTLHDGHRWTLSGADLDAAAAAAQTHAAAAGLGGSMAAVVTAVNACPDGATAADVATVCGIDEKTAADYLARAARAGRVDRITRGRYGPTAPSLRVESVESVEMWGPW